VFQGPGKCFGAAPVLAIFKVRVFTMSLKIKVYSDYL
jgi:hypothetical protein